jgi:hypothetical protein
MRVAITDQLLATQSDVDRQTQRLHSACALLSGEATPKLISLEHGDSFDRQQIDALTRRLTHRERSATSLRDANDSLQLRSNSDLKNHTTLKTNLLGGDGFAGGIITDLGDISRML